MSTIKVDTIQNTSGVQQYLAKAWVKFTGVTTTTITASGNVSSLTDVGTGKTTVTFSNAMATASYSVAGTSAKSNATDDGNSIVQAHGYSAGASNADTTTATNVRSLIASVPTLADTVASVMVIQ